MRLMSAGLKLIPFALVLNATVAMAADPDAAQSPPIAGASIGLADSAGLRATVFGAPPQDVAPLPAKVPLSEINAELPWRLPVPQILWFDAKLRVWLSAQDKPAPLAIVISGTGSDGNTKTMSVLRAALYGAGYHVLTMPSPTFPGFIVSASSTGVAGDLMRDGKDLYAAMQEIVAHLPRKVRITDIDVVGYSLGGANAAVVKSIDATEHKLKIHRVVMINPPVSLFSSVGRLDRLFAATIGPGEHAVELLYRRLYAQIANLYRASDRLELDENFLLTAGAATLKTDADFSAAIALTFRLQLVDMFFIGDLYAKTGVITDPLHPPKVGDSLEDIQRDLRAKPFADYFTRVFAPYYLQRRPDANSASLIASNRLDIITDVLRDDGNYYAQTTSNDLILNKRELAWLQETLGRRLVVYDHGGHLGEIGERQQVADMLDMLSGSWPRSAP
jgi:pimeloyl-ACP methyl ester carboxylesterase